MTFISSIFGEQKYSLYEKFGIGEKQLLYEEKFFLGIYGHKKRESFNFS